ncbi:MAG: AraC family transcriptional regulator [Muribaculaceae bacterium]|nr:AraC family transcriptional regulator [Muribaculaceae bacterium]
MIEPLTIREINRLKKFTAAFSRLGEDYIYARIMPGSGLSTAEMMSSLRLNGIMLLLVCDGNINLTVNMDRFTLGNNTLLLLGPSSIVKHDDPGLGNLDAHMMFISHNFLHDINFDINLLSTVPVSVEHKPMIQLTDQESGLLVRYLDLIHLNTVTNNNPGDELYTKSIARNMLASIMYQLLAIAQRRSKETEQHRSRSRRVTYTHDFIRLVQNYYRQERSVKFYADKLYISPKYLSLVIKETTGRTAAAWIDDYVVMEAKNLLRFSGKNIQQVAYELNFTNQSSFGKYFKHLTGMSPSEFIRT